MPVRTPALSAVRTRRTERDPVAWGVMVTDVLGDEIDCLWDELAGTGVGPEPGAKSSSKEEPSLRMPRTTAARISSSRDALLIFSLPSRSVM